MVRGSVDLCGRATPFLIWSGRSKLASSDPAILFSRNPELCSNRNTRVLEKPFMARLVLPFPWYEHQATCWKHHLRCCSSCSARLGMSGGSGLVDPVPLTRSTHVATAIPTPNFYETVSAHLQKVAQCMDMRLSFSPVAGSHERSSTHPWIGRFPPCLGPSIYLPTPRTARDSHNTCSPQDRLS